MSATTFESKLMGIRNNMLNFAFVLTANIEDAKDLVQDTTLKVLDNKDKYTEDTNFKGWVLTVMRNIFINNYRKSSSANVFVDTTDDLYHLNVSQNPSEIEPEGSFTVKEIQAAINTLDSDMREPLNLLLTGYKYEEVAETLNVPIGTVKTRVFNARKILQKRFSGYNFA